MKIKSPSNGTTRRVFINRSLTAAGGMVFLSHAHAWPAWASEAVEGTIERMGRIAFDPEEGRAWTSKLVVEIKTREVQTRYGPTKVSDVTDRILVESDGPLSRQTDVSAGQREAKLDPRIEARGGRACLAWCAMDHETRRWRVFASVCDDGNNWSEPMEAAGGERPALHPDLAIEPDTKKVWIAYEDWEDRSIRLTSYHGSGWSRPVKLSEGGHNYRPRVIVTRKEGRNAGAIAVAWDSYRGGSYNVCLRLIGTGGKPGPEIQVTQSPLWDCEPDVAEDLEGNLWVAWVRASNELTRSSRLRTVHARFFDGKTWRWPNKPETAPESDDGRLTGYAVCLHPQLIVDRHNRVHLFYRNHSEFMWGFLHHMCYEGDRWSKDKRIKEWRPEDSLNFIWEYGVAMDNRGVFHAVYDSLYVKRLGFASRVHKMIPAISRSKKKSCKVTGRPGEDSTGPGWPERKRPPRRTVRVKGRTLTLLYGDTHSHSWTSDGIDPADMFFHFARDYARLDYWALSDHDFTISNTPGLEAYIAFLPKAFNRPDFVCFQAYEFSSQKTGHRVVIFEGDDNPTFPLTYPPKHRSNTNAELYPFLRKFALSPDSRVLVTAHNMYELGNEFKGWDKGLEPLYDATSLHTPAEKPLAAYLDVEKMDKSAKGSGIWATIGKILAVTRSEKDEKTWHMCWRDCLAAGLPLGAFGTSDTHSANAIGYVTSAVWAEKKDRKSIFDAFFARRTLALDSDLRSRDIGNVSPPWEADHKEAKMSRPEVRFHLDGYFMGSSVRMESAPRARAVVKNEDDPVRAVVFIKDGAEEHTVFGQGEKEVQAEWKDPSFTRGSHYYYVRVEFESGSLAFSSPVFINYAQ